MSNVASQPVSDVVRMRLEVLRHYHNLVVRSGEERLRLAMAEYAQQFRGPQELEPNAAM